MWGNYCNMLHSLCSILPTSEVVETRFFVFLNMFYRRFPVWCMSWLTHKQANRFIRHKRYVYMSVCVCVCVCVCVSVWVCVCLRPFTANASSVWNSWNFRKQINDVVLKTFLSSAKSLYRYFRMKHWAFLTFSSCTLEARKAAI